MVDEWRDSTTAMVASLQESGVLRKELAPSDFLRSLGALALGAGAGLLADAREGSVEQELRMLDGFVDALSVLPPDRSDEAT